MHACIQYAQAAHSQHFTDRAWLGLAWLGLTWLGLAGLGYGRIKENKAEKLSQLSTYLPTYYEFNWRKLSSSYIEAAAAVRPSLLIRFLFLLFLLQDPKD